MTDVSGKVAVITGAGSGLGRALAYELGRRGVKLAVSDVDSTGLAETVKQLRVIGAPVHDARLDVTDRAGVLSYADDVVSHYGTVNVVVNNAGIAFTGDIADMTFDQLEQIMDADFWSVVNGTKAFLPHVIASGDGHLVNISSVFGLFSVAGMGAYNAAKFAVRGFTEALRQEMLLAGHPVQVTCVHPGGMKTAIVGNAGTVEGHDRENLIHFFDTRLAKTSADAAARQILRGVARNRPKVLIGLDAILLDKLVRVLGSSYQRLAVRAVGRNLPSRVGAQTGSRPSGGPPVDEKGRARVTA